MEMEYSNQGVRKVNKKTNQNKNQNEHGWDGDVHPEIAAIDHNANLEPIEQLMKIFSAYNHQHRNEGTAWSVWPDWELVLTSMKDELHFINANSDTQEVIEQRQHWLQFTQFINDCEAITLDGYTIIVGGNHGQQFMFDMCMEYEYWVTPRSLDEHYQKTNSAKKGLLGPPWKRNTLLHFVRHEVSHSLEAYWQCPEHVAKYGGKWTRYTHDSSFCIEPNADETFPQGMMRIIQMCIEDTEIWSVLFEKDLSDIEHHEFMEREWPGGIPDQDWEYQ